MRSAWILGCMLAALPLWSAPERGVNLLTDPGFEQGARGWRKAGAGFSLAPDEGRNGGTAIRCESTDPQAYHGALQELTFDPPIKHPFKVSGWSRAENAGGVDYCLYLDCWYDDGTNLWGQRREFTAGTHDWERIEYVFDPAKPITKIQYFILFRRCSGTAWFDDLSLSLAPFEMQGEQLRAGLFGGASVDWSARLSLPAKWRVQLLRGPQVLCEASGSGQGPKLTWAGAGSGEHKIRLDATDNLLGESLTHERPYQAEGGPRRAFTAWTESTMNRVFITSLPPQDPRPLEGHIALAGNEYEGFQIVLRTPGDGELKGCTVRCGELRDGAGHVIPADNWQWHQVGFVEIARPWNHPLLPEEATPGWWPDPLLPVRTFDVPPGTTQPLWVTLHAPPGTPAGEYRGVITVDLGASGRLQVPVVARVYGFDVPNQPHIKTAFALMDGFLEKLYGTPLDPKLRRAYGDYVLQHRLNPDDISRTDPPDIEDIAYYDARGLNAFNVINMVEPRGKRTWVCFSPLSVYTPSFKASLIQRLDPYVAELKRRGLAKKAYVYTFDERPAEYNPVIAEYFGMIKERYGIPTLTTAKVPQDPEIMKALHVDWNCPLTSVYDFEAAERCRQAGLQVWAYVCMGPRYPYANWLADDPLVEARVIWWQAYQQKMDGLLYWGLNIWARRNNDYLIDPEQDGPRLRWSITTGGAYDFLHGDGELLYAGKEGPIGCIRLDNIRDGIEDYEYLWLLAEKTASVEAARAACAPVSTDLRVFTRDPTVVLAQRQVVAERIEALKARP